MDPREPLRLLARYNAWATRRLLGAVAALPETDYRRDAGLFFRSVHGTLNHLLVAEHALWWRRFAEGVSPAVALDSELEPDRARLAERLLDASARWPAFVETLGAERLQGRLDYTTTRGKPASLPFGATLMHVFNHGTHHRGQVTAALTALQAEAPELDLVFMLQQEEEAAR